MILRWAALNIKCVYLHVSSSYITLHNITNGGHINNALKNNFDACFKTENFKIVFAIYISYSFQLASA